MNRSGLVAAACALLAVSGLLATPVPVSALGSAAHTAVTTASPAYNWAEFHDGPTLRGYASNSPLSTADASHLGVAWATDLYAPAVDSPAVSYDAALGQMLDVIGTENGNMIAVDATNGHIVWSNWLGSPIRSSPLVIAGSVWVATFNSARIYKLNATTGAVECSTAAPEQIEGTPLAATPPGGVPTVYFGTLDGATADGPMMALNAATCAVEWSFTGYRSPAGSWDPISYAVDATHEPLVLFGTDDPDSTVYALNAVTGKEVWRFTSIQPPGDYDIGAGVTISPPGVNGFSDGVAYAQTKDGIVSALNLTTGAKIWSINYPKELGHTGGGLSTAALALRSLVFGYQSGLADLNPLTGAIRWTYRDPSRIEVDSSPAIAGRPGSQIVAVGDLGGGLDVVSLATGKQLYHYQTASYITASPAISDGNIAVASADGYLYDFALGGGNGTLPSTTIKAPADSSAVANPNGSLSVEGTAADATGVAGVEVAVQESGTDGPWWDNRSRSWVSGPVGNSAVVAAPGAASSVWTFSYPVPPAGGTFEVTAYAVGSSGQSDVAGARTSFAVRATTTGPYLTARPGYVAPGSAVSVTGAGFAHSEPITISLLGTTLATTTSSAKGRISNTLVRIASNAVFGQTSLTARGRSSGKTATAAITIANSWDQLGDSASHTNLEPNDSTFYNSIDPGDDIFLDAAWRYQFGAPIDTAPAIAGGVAYAGTTAGQLAAVDVHNGALLWTWSLPSGAAIAGSPAVDPSKGLVFVGADNGTLDAVRISTRKLAWSDSIGGDISAPVFGNGELYITSSSGNVEAVVELTGAKSWIATFHSRITDAPSLDTARDTLVVGASDGRIAALATASGATKWFRSTAGAVSAAAMIFDGIVYFGAGDSMEAVNEKSGAAVWSHKTGGPISDSPALTGTGQVMIGSGDGNLYDLAISNGSVVWILPIHHPIIGVAAVKSVVIFDTSSGLIGAARSWTSRQGLWYFETSAGITSPPAIVDATVYVGAGDGDLYAFTTYGHLPR